MPANLVSMSPQRRHRRFVHHASAAHCPEIRRRVELEATHGKLEVPVAGALIRTRATEIAANDQATKSGVVAGLTSGMTVTP